MPRDYAIIDVFTDKALTGNPLAVILNASGLEEKTMQTIAQEFNLSETVFVFPPKAPTDPTPIRIFTPQHELPFAGHPTVGTAILLGHERFQNFNGELNAVITLNQTIGVVRCGLVLRSNSSSYSEFDIPKLPKQLDLPFGLDEIATALNIEPSEIGFENHVPTKFDAGVPFYFVPVRNLEIIRQTKPNLEYWSSLFGSEGSDSVFVYTRETLTRNSNFHARMFAPSMGIPEDPATGSAVAAFSGVINLFDQLPEGIHKVRVEQGYEINRPSQIDLEIEIGGSEIKNVRIGGHAIIIARGKLFV